MSKERLDVGYKFGKNRNSVKMGPRRDWYAPGSTRARIRGCVCPVLDNNRGYGEPSLGWVYHEDCELHESEYADAMATIEQEE